jgi:hypothetical protein
LGYLNLALDCVAVSYTSGWDVMLIRDWIDQKELKKNQSKNFEEKDLKTAMNATAYDLAPFVSK